MSTNHAADPGSVQHVRRRLATRRSRRLTGDRDTRRRAVDESAAPVDNGIMRRDVTTVWARIEANAGETFRQERGAAFTYEVRGGSVVPDRTNRLLPKTDFEKALQVPLNGPGEIQHLQGPSYTYALLMDPRIRAKDW
jgi:hypothetical protein